MLDAQAVDMKRELAGGRRAPELEVRVAPAHLFDLERSGRQLLEPRGLRAPLSARIVRRRRRRAERLERQRKRVRVRTGGAWAPLPLEAGLREAGDHTLECDPTALRGLDGQLARRRAVRPQRERARLRRSCVQCSSVQWHTSYMNTYSIRG